MTAEKGIISDENYPYLAKDHNTCPLKTKLPFKNKGVTKTPDGNCDAIKEAL